MFGVVRVEEIRDRPEDHSEEMKVTARDPIFR
jgi:hypothetical protein